MKNYLRAMKQIMNYMGHDHSIYNVSSPLCEGGKSVKKMELGFPHESKFQLF